MGIGNSKKFAMVVDDGFLQDKWLYHVNIDIYILAWSGSTK